MAIVVFRSVGSPREVEKVNGKKLNHLSHLIEMESEYMQPYIDLVDAFENIYDDDFTKEENEILGKAFKVVENKVGEYRRKIDGFKEEMQNEYSKFDR